MDYRTDVATKPFVSMTFRKTPMDSHKDATACYELQMPKIRRRQPLRQPSCWEKSPERLPPKMTLNNYQT